jgi:hypothetical protein
MSNPSEVSPVRFKIQVPGVVTWCDLPGFYPSREEAEADLADMVAELDDFTGRVVHESEPGESLE